LYGRNASAHLDGNLIPTCRVSAAEKAATEAFGSLTNVGTNKLIDINLMVKF
jgi:hypothetical protein